MFERLMRRPSDREMDDLLMLCDATGRRGAPTERQKRLLRWARQDMPAWRAVACLRQYVRLGALEKPSRTEEWGIKPDAKKEVFRRRAAAKKKQVSFYEVKVQN